MSNYASDPETKQLVDTYDWKFVPIANPDGYSYTWTDASYNYITLILNEIIEIEFPYRIDCGVRTASPTTDHCALVLTPTAIFRLVSVALGQQVRPAPKLLTVQMPSPRSNLAPSETL